MFTLLTEVYSNKPTFYETLTSQLQALVRGERDFIANAANFSALLYGSLPDLNWAGIYRRVGAELVLGPFQGKPACVRIPLGRGVCGTAAAEKRTIVVPDVQAFPGHIACDRASRSEIVVPLLHQHQVVGVLDLDSPKEDRFDTQDAAGLNCLCQVIMASSDLAERP